MRLLHQMQKISSYLYPNRILVNVNLAPLSTEWRIVYQRKIKIYKGYENVIELDIKNSDQKRIDVSDNEFKCLIMDELGQEVYTADVVHSTTPGLATFNVPADAVELVSPQFLRYALYILNEDDTRSVVYGDTQFGATGTMELIGTAAVTVPLPKVIKTFMPLDSTNIPYVRTYYSEAAEINPPNDIRAETSLDLEFLSLGLEAEVQVQVSYAPVISNAVEWETLETFNIASSTNSITKTYSSTVDFNKEVVWLRITYVRANNNTGKFDRINVIV